MRPAERETDREVGDPRQRRVGAREQELAQQPGRVGDQPAEGRVVERGREHPGAHEVAERGEPGGPEHGAADEHRGRQEHERDREHEEHGVGGEDHRRDLGVGDDAEREPQEPDHRSAGDERRARPPGRAGARDAGAAGHERDADAGEHREQRRGVAGGDPPDPGRRARGVGDVEGVDRHHPEQRQAPGGVDPDDAPAAARDERGGVPGATRRGGAGVAHRVSVGDIAVAPRTGRGWCAQPGGRSAPARVSWSVTAGSSAKPLATSSGVTTRWAFAAT